MGREGEGREGEALGPAPLHIISGYATEQIARQLRAQYVKGIYRPNYP